MATCRCLRPGCWWTLGTPTTRRSAPARPPLSRQPGSIRCRTSAEWPRTGGRRRSGRLPSAGRRSSGGGGASTPRSRSWGWSALTATSTRRPGRPCSPRSGRCSMRSHGRPRRTTRGHPPSGGPTPPAGGGRGGALFAARPPRRGGGPHVTITVGTDALAESGHNDGNGAHPSRLSELDHAGPVDPELGRRIVCDGSIRRVVLAGRSEPLDVGRRTPVVSPALRRAVIVRDRGCRFPGCDRPHSWCDAHHVVHWADGGPTALPNLVLLCRRHHRLIHCRGGFTLRLEDGRPVFRRRDRSVLADRAPP